MEQGAPGLTWQPGGSTPRTIRTKHRANTSAEAIKKFIFDYPNQKPYCVGNYAAAELSVTETLDEHQATTLTYVNSSGQIVANKSHAYNTTGEVLLMQQQTTLAGDGPQPAAAPTPPVTTPYFIATYYVHDDFGNLRAVIQPEGVKELAALSDWNTGITATFLTKWCFQYTYDAQQRLIEKQVPGGGGTYLVYNAKDQLIATATSRDLNGGNLSWQVIKYDVLGRPVLTGYKNLGLNRSALQSNVDGQPGSALLYESRTTADQGYTLAQAYPALAAGDVQTVTFYDDYTYPSLTTLPFVAENGATAAFGRLTGAVTGHLERVLGSTQWLVTRNFYDAKERPIQSRTTNFLGGETRVTTAFDFLDRPTATLLTHSANGTSNTIRNTFTYDHAGRVQLVTQQMDAAPVVIVSSSAYDVLGKLVDKKLHSTDNGLKFLQSIDYRYNIRGWLSNINDRDLPLGADGTDVEPDLFGLELKYDTPNQAGLLGGQAQYNGNVSQALWRTRNAATGTTLRGYSYQYDLLNRLKAADYATYEVSASTGQWEWGKTKSDYSVSGINYSDNGNILNLNRRGRLSALSVTTNPVFGDLDKLKYKYNGNQLVGVDDAAAVSVLPHDFEDNGNKYQTSGNNEYAYDASGNLLRDDNKGISSIAYNQLNQPTLITFVNGNSLQFTYTADGQKVRKVATPAGGSATTTDYVSGFVYENGQLKFGPMPEGRVLRNPGTPTFAWKYEYHLKDHLGNLRFAFRDYGGSAYQRGITAGMEPADAPKEEQNFRRVAETRVRDAAHARTGRYVARLNAAQGTGLGPSIRWAVQPGDSIGAEVYGRYERPARAARSARRPRLLLLPGVALPAARPAPGETAAPGAARPATPQLSLGLAVVPGPVRSRALAPPADALPQAYLELRLFARDSQLLAVRRQPLTTEAGNHWQHLSTGLTADSAGYAEARLVNESAEPAAFDDMALKPIDTGNIQENHYDPFGLNLVGIEAETAYPSKFQFNGQEKQEEFGLNWTHYGARFYDAQIGRWHSPDAYSGLTHEESPFAYVSNNPVNNIDVDGHFKIDARFAAQYPHLANVLKNYLPQLKDNPTVRQAFKDITGQSDAFFDDMVAYGRGPWVTPTQEKIKYSGQGYSGDPLFEATNQFYRPYGNNLFISSGAIQEFETALAEAEKSGSRESVANLNERLFKLITNILHEAAHRGLYIKNPERSFAKDSNESSDQGTAFEALAYGAMFSHDNRLSDGAGAEDAYVARRRAFLARNQRNNNSLGLRLNNGSISNFLGQQYEMNRHLLSERVETGRGDPQAYYYFDNIPAPTMTVVGENGMIFRITPGDNPNSTDSNHNPKFR